MKKIKKISNIQTRVYLKLTINKKDKSTNSYNKIIWNIPNLVVKSRLWKDDGIIYCYYKLPYKRIINKMRNLFGNESTQLWDDKKIYKIKNTKLLNSKNIEIKNIVEWYGN